MTKVLIKFSVLLSHFTKGNLTLISAKRVQKVVNKIISSSIAIDGNYSQWTEWSDCDVTCGRGVQNRSRSCTSPPPQYDGKSCEGLGPVLFEAIDGDYTEWSKWSKCSVTCGRGSRTRTRECTNPPPQYGGKECSDLVPVNDTQGCNTTACRKSC